MRKRILLALIVSGVVILLVAATAAAKGNPPAPITLTNQETLGKDLFFDTNLSDPAGEACAACHGPQVGYTGPIQSINAAGAVYQGAVTGRFGNRKPPSAAYAGESPNLYYDAADGTWVGGMFWDGRATGSTLGDPLAEQAQGPFLNPLEQNNASAQAVIDKVSASSYSALFFSVCTDNSAYYECIARAIAAYERSAEVSQFTSKYDYWLVGKAKMTGQELLGMQLFNGKAMCANCHVAPLFTDFTYDNLGVPKNPSNPFYSETAWNPLGAAWIDDGLGGFLKSNGYDAAVYDPEMGKFKVPTLRNVGLQPTSNFVKAYAHNGYFKSLEEIVHFYNTRDVLPDCGTVKKPKPGKNCWPAPEYAATVNREELGNLGLSHGEEMALVAFMKTLSDGYIPGK